MNALTTPEEFRRRIVYEDDDLLIIDKPSGWLMYESRPGELTLLVWALEYLQASSSVSECTPAFVHRLDKETSGVTVLAKTKPAIRSLNRQLKLKQIQKKYLALLAGEIRPHGSIQLALQKQMDRTRWLAVMVPTKHGGIYAQTDYTRLGLFAGAGESLSYVEAQPRTGRTHQIRAHFAAIGCPIVGDDLYGNTKLNEKLRQELGVQRMLLHAFTMEFAHPTTGERMRCEAPLPKDFEGVLRRLAAAST